MIEFSTAQMIALLIIPLLFGIVVHEVAHGWVAYKFGDPTAKMLGRLTLNPIKHIDPLGTIIVPALLMYVGGMIFGWAKPVPVDGRNFKKFNLHMFLTTVAGPASNFMMACIWFFLLLAFMQLDQNSLTGAALRTMADLGVRVNIVLMVLNLLPIPPLDGGQAVMCLLPGHWSWKMKQFEPYGFITIVFLIYFGVINAIMQPFFGMYYSLLKAILG